MLKSDLGKDSPLKSNAYTLAGELTLEEFITGAKEHPDIMEMLTKMMDLTHVLEIIVNGQKKKEWLPVFDALHNKRILSWLKMISSVAWKRKTDSVEGETC